MDFHNYFSIDPDHRKKVLRCKSNAQCSVFGCHNRSEAGLYLLPKEDNLNLRKQWIHTLCMAKVPKNAMVCGKHFKDEDFITPTRFSKGKIRRLRKSAIPSQNLPKSIIYRSPSSAKKTSIKNREERSVKRRLLMAERPQEPESKQIENSEITDAPAEPDCKLMEDAEVQCNIGTHSLGKLTQDAEVQCNTLTCGFDVGIRFIDFVSTDERMLAFTGLKSMQKFNCICEAVEELLSAKSDEKLCSHSTMCTRQCVLLTLIELKMNISFSNLSAFFDISEKLASDIFFSTIDLLYVVLKDRICWPLRDDIRDNMPNVFKKLFPTTRVILNCIEINVQQFSCFACKTREYSQDICNHTMKVLIGISPSSVITFVSKPFGGCTSDKFIFVHSKILEKCERGDAVMVDGGFSVQNECISAGIQLIQPPLLEKKNPLTPEECDDNYAIFEERVHVERIMRRIKVFQMLNNKIALIFLESLDKIIKIVCALVNLSEPILSDRHFDSPNSCDDIDSDVSD